MKIEVFHFFKTFIIRIGPVPRNKIEEESSKVFLSLPKPEAKQIEKKELGSPKQLYNESGTNFS